MSLLSVMSQVKQVISKPRFKFDFTLQMVQFPSDEEVFLWFIVISVYSISQ